MSLTTLPPVGYLAPAEPLAAAPLTTPGTSYVQLARTERHRWWRPIVALVALVASMAALLLAYAFVTLGIGALFSALTPEASGFENAILNLAWGLGLIALLLPALFIGMAAWRRPIGTLSSVAGGLRWRWMADCLLVAALVIGAQMALFIGMVIIGGGWTWGSLQGIAFGLLAVVLLVPFQAAAEEYLFRGWLLQFFGSYTRKAWVVAAVGVPVSSVLFMFAHGYEGWNAFYILAFAVVSCYVTIRTGGLEAAIAFHVTTNMIAFGFTAVTGSIEATFDQSGTTDADWFFVAIRIVVLIVFAVVVTKRARRRSLQTVS